MSDYMDDTPLTDEEIAAAIAAAKKAKAERVKAQQAKTDKSEKPKSKKKKEQRDDDSSESLFDEIDSTYDEGEEELSPKMKSAKSFSNAFAAARSRREENLRKKKAEKETQQEERDDVVPARDLDEESEQDVVFDTESEELEVDEAYEEYDSEEVADFSVDDEDEYYTADGDDSEQVEFDGIFQPDDEDTPNFGERVPVDEIDSDDDDDYDDDDDEDDEDDDDDDDAALSTKAKVIIGIIIAVLILAVAGAACYFILNGDTKGGEQEPVVSNDGTSVTSIEFAEPSISLRVGESAPLNIIVEPETATDKTFSLKTGDSSIATVDDKGYVTGISSGSTTVTATLKSNETITATVVINVIDEDQNAINIYNNLINSILDGSTDIDSDDTDEEEDLNSEEESDEDSDTDTESDSEDTDSAKDVLTGSIIRDLNDDGALELALYYENEDTGANVRIFYLADDTDEDEVEETQYDEYGNPIETEETDSDTEEESDTDAAQNKPVEKILTELDIYSEMYSVCYSALETDLSSWDTVYVEIKEEETSKVKVTILSDDYTSPTYVYESSDESIATVDNQGVVTAVKPGTCYITVTSPLNSDAKATVKIRVKDDTDLLEDYLAQIPIVNQTNDAVIPTETLIAKKIADIDGDGVSELLLKFSYGNNVETINLVKIENEQCIVYKTYGNISDLYDYYEGDGSYENTVLISTSSGKVCLDYKAVVAKEDSKTRNTEEKLFSVEDSGSLSELVSFSTTTDITTKTVTSEVEIEDDSEDDVSSEEDESQWYDEPSDDEEYYDDGDDNYYGNDDNGYDDGGDDGNDWYYAGYAAVALDDSDNDSAALDFSNKTREKTLPQITGEPDGDDDVNSEDDFDDNSDANNDDNDDNDEPSSKVTSTVTSEVTEEETQYFVNGQSVQESVYNETLLTYSGRYSAWSDWDTVS